MMRSLLVLAVLFLAATLAGCQFWSTPQFYVTLTPDSGHPTLADGGLKVSLSCTGGGASRYQIDWGDGESETSLDGRVTHVYRPPYDKPTYTVHIVNGQRTVSKTVTIENNPPEVYPPMYFRKGPFFEWMDKVVFDIRYQVHGCNTTLEAYGIRDMDGDPLTFEWHIQRDGVQAEDTVFSADREPVNGVPSQGDLFVWFPGWTGATPPYPFSVQCASPAPTPPLAPSHPTVPVTITLIARDPWGGTGSWTLDGRVQVNTCK